MCSILWAILGLSYLLFDPIVKHLVLKRLVLRNDSDFAAIWRNPPIKPHFKVSQKSLFFHDLILALRHVFVTVSKAAYKERAAKIHSLITKIMFYRVS